MNPIVNIAAHMIKDRRCMIGGRPIASLLKTFGATGMNQIPELFREGGFGFS